MIFSFKHNWHGSDRNGLLIDFKMFHLIVGALLFSFNNQIYLDNSVSLEYFLLLNDFVWLRYLSLMGNNLKIIQILIENNLQSRNK